MHGYVLVVDGHALIERPVENRNDLIPPRAVAKCTLGISVVPLALRAKPEEAASLALASGGKKRLDLVVTLKDWQDMDAVDRIGLDREFYEILGLQVPHVTIPVRPGRDMARLIEVAAMDQKLKGLGQNSALEFNTKLLNLMEQKE